MAKYPRIEQEQRRLPPATTPEGSESQMCSLALELAEKRLRNGTASAQEIVYFAKNGSLSARTEREILEKQKELLMAKTESLRSAQNSDVVYAEAIAAIRSYGGNQDRTDNGDY